MKYIKICMMAIILSATTVVPNAYAVHKLDFWAPVSDFLQKVQKMKEKAEEKYAQIMQQANEKVKKATGLEGAALFKAVVPQNLSDIRKGLVDKILAGEWDFDSMLKGALPEMANMKLDWESFKRLSADYDRALTEEKLAKDKKIDERLALLYPQAELLRDEIKEFTYTGDPNNMSDKMDADMMNLSKKLQLQKIAQEIADLEQQKSTNVPEKTKKFQAEMEELNKKIQENNKEISETQVFKDLTNKTDEAINKLFSKTSEDDTKDLYAGNLSKLFLGKYQLVNAENINKIMKNRKTEYYNAVINLMEAALEVDGRTVKVAEDTQNMKEAMTEVAEGNYGAKAMQIGVDIETAKTAARFVQLKLAKLRLESTKTMQSWTDFYKMRDGSKYSKSTITFSLDDYILNDSKLAQLKGMGMDKAQDFIDSFSF